MFCVSLNPPHKLLYMIVSLLCLCIHVIFFFVFLSKLFMLILWCFVFLNKSLLKIPVLKPYVSRLSLLTVICSFDHWYHCCKYSICLGLMHLWGMTSNKDCHFVFFTMQLQFEANVWVSSCFDLLSTYRTNGKNGFGIDTMNAAVATLNVKNISYGINLH